MTSEIRVNKINNRAGLGTVEYTPTGIIVSGIVTAYEFDGNFDTTPGIVITGIGTAQSLDVDDFVDVGSNIKLGNAGVVTATTFSTANVDVTTDKIVVGSGVTIEANQVATGQATFTGIVTASAFKLPDGSNAGNDLTSVTTNIVPDGDNTRTIGSSSNTFTSVFTRQVKGNNSNFINFDATGGIEVFAKSGQYISLKGGNNTRGLTVGNTGVIPDHSSVNLGASANKWNEVHAQYYYGDGSNLTGLSGVSVSNQGDNRIVTSSSTTNALVAESTVTWDGTQFVITGSNNITSYAASAALMLKGGDAAGDYVNFAFRGDNHAIGTISGYTSNTNGTGQLIFSTSNSGSMAVSYSHLTLPTNREV